MSSGQTSPSAGLSAQNIGGIDETEVTFSNGVTVLKGENATNRTSLLQAIMAALGSDDVSIKGDADEAYVELELDDGTYTRDISRNGSTIQTGGNPYLEESMLADLFAFLLESNDARRTVVARGDFRELIMRPIDTEAIEREIERRLEERRELDRDLQELDGLKDRLPALEERRTQLRAKIEEREAELTDIEAKIRKRDANLEETREEKAALDDRLSQLSSKRSDLEDVRYDLETERESLESVRGEKREVTAELEDLPEVASGEVDDLESELEQLRERQRRLESGINEVQSVIGFNQELLEDADGDVLGVLADASEDVTEGLLPEGRITCWTCGSEVPKAQIETTVERLQELSQTKLGEVNDVEARIDDVSSEIRNRREQQQRREDLQRRIDDASREIQRGEAAIERLDDRRESLQSEIADLEAEISDLEDETYEEVLDLHKEANRLEYDIGRLESDLQDVEEEITDVESRLDEECRIQSRREELDAEIADLRTKIDRIESDAVEAFNDHMDAVLDVMEYENLERVWLECVERDGNEGNRTDSKRTFELHIVRTTDGGATYEDTIAHLSESEREVVGLVFALAGYLAHGVYEDVPFILLDSLEAIDAERIARLVEYVEEYTEYLVVALLPEDAAALSDAYDRVTDI